MFILFINKEDFMTFDDFKFICFNYKIDPNIIESCRPFIIKNDYIFNFTRKGHANDDLGYAELDDIDTKQKSIDRIKSSIEMSTCDYDIKGRSLRTVRTRRLIKNPGKHLPRLVLKSYFLYYYDL